MNFELFLFTAFLSTFTYIGVRVLIWLYGYYTRVKKINKIKGFPMIPFIGNTQMDINKNLLQQSVENSKMFKDEQFFRYWFGVSPTVYIHKADHLEVLLSGSKHIEKAYEYTFLTPWLKSGLLLSSGEKWHHRRKLITPTFHFDILKEYIPVMNEQTNILIDILTQKANNSEPVDIFHTMTLTTLDIICETAMGINIDAQNNQNNEYVKAVLDISKLIVDRLFYLPYWSEFIFNRSDLGKRHNKCLEILHAFTRKVIIERNADYDENNNVYSPTNKKNRVAFLDLLLKMKHEDKTLSFDDIQEEVDTFMFAGHDTTATSLSWTLHSIGSHFDVQKKLHEEIDSVFCTSDRLVTNDDLSSLRYLDCVIKESLRLFPPVPFYSRNISEEVEIAGFKLPIGTTAAVFSYMIHRDERYFPEPEQFRPERFLNENGSTTRHPYAYIPFSAGKRNCIGQRFAQIEEKLILTNILRKFEIKSLKTTEEIEPFADILLRPKNQILIEFKQRN